MATLRQGDKGKAVRALQKRLEQAGFPPGLVDGVFGGGTEAALRAFQLSEHLVVDGVAGPQTLNALGIATADDVVPDHGASVQVQAVSEMFPFTPLGNIRENLPPVMSALQARQIADKPMILAALATIRAETESFEPVAEGRSRYNTSPRGHPFDLYDNRHDLGNEGPPDGERFRGRGYIQLTGRYNYSHYGQALGMDRQLLDDPALASRPDVAGQLLAAFLKDREGPIRQALADQDLTRARRLVNGGSHGLDRFADAYRRGMQVISVT